MGRGIWIKLRLDNLVSDGPNARTRNIRRSTATCAKNTDEIAVVLLLDDTRRVWHDVWKCRIEEIRQHRSVEICRCTDEIGRGIAGARPILERPLRIGVSLRPGNDCHIALVARQGRDVVHCVSDVFTVHLRVVVHCPRNVKVCEIISWVLTEKFAEIRDKIDTTVGSCSWHE